MGVTGIKTSAGKWCFFLLLVATMVLVAAGDSSQFFLKTSKSVPRMGRRGDPNVQENLSPFFLKTSKSVPRLGRRGQPEWPSQQDLKEDQGSSQEVESNMAAMQEIPPALRERIWAVAGPDDSNRGIWWMG